GPGNLFARNKRPFVEFKKNWPLWIILFAIASVVTLLWNIASKQSTARWRERILLLVLAGLWLALCWNNARLLPFHAGFDAPEHPEYITYIQEHRAFPLPTYGLQTYQPPL